MNSTGSVPKGTADLGIVIMPNPEVPSSPVIVKATCVDAADWFVVILRWDICELVMFPLISRSTVVPLSVVAGTVVKGVGFGVGVGVTVGVGVGVGVGEAVGVGVGVGGGVGVETGSGVGEVSGDEGAGVGDGSIVGVGVSVGVGVDEGSGISD